jgi:hypothetical protein
MANQKNKVVTQKNTFTVGQYVWVTIPAHKSRIGATNIAGVIVALSKYHVNAYHILTRHGLLATALQVHQFQAAHPEQMPELADMCVMWNTDEAVAEVMKEKGKSIMEIHNIIMIETGITQRQQLVAEMRARQEKPKRKRLSVAKRAPRTHTKTKKADVVADVDAYDPHAEPATPSDADGDDEPVPSVDNMYIPGNIAGERVFAGVKKYLISWLDFGEEHDSWEDACKNNTLTRTHTQSTHRTQNNNTYAYGSCRVFGLLCCVSHV